MRLSKLEIGLGKNNIKNKPIGKRKDDKKF